MLHKTTGYVAGVSQAQLISLQSPSPGRHQPVTAPTHVTSTVMSRRYSVTSPAQMTSSILPGRPQQAVAPTQVTAAIVTGMPHTTIVSSHVPPTSSVTIAPRLNVGPSNNMNNFASNITQPSTSSSINIPISSKTHDVPQELASDVTSSVTQITTAVVTGVPKPTHSPYVSSSVVLVSEPSMTSQANSLSVNERLPSPQSDSCEVVEVLDSHSDCISVNISTDNKISQPEVTLDRSSHNTCTVGNNNTVPVVPKSPKVSMPLATAVVSGVPKATSKICAPIVENTNPIKYSSQSTNVSNFGLSEPLIYSPPSSALLGEPASTLATKMNIPVISDVPKPTKASTQATTAVVSCLPKTPKVSTQIATAIVPGVPKQTQDITLTPTTSVTLMAPTFKSSHDTSSAGIQALSSPYKASSPQVTTAFVCGVPKPVSTIEHGFPVASCLPSKSHRSSQVTTAVVSGVQKQTTPSLQVHTVSEATKSFSSTSVATACSANKLTSSQSNTAIVSGIPRASVAPTHVKMKSDVSKSKSENNLVASVSSAVRSPVATASANHVHHQVPHSDKFGKEVSSLAPQPSFQKDSASVMHKPVQENKTVTVSPVISTVPESPVTSSNSLKITKEGPAKNTCSVSPMNTSEGIKVLPLLKRESLISIPSSKVATTDAAGNVSTKLPITDLKIPEPTASWTPRGVESVVKSDSNCASNILSQMSASAEPAPDIMHASKPSSSLGVNFNMKSLNHNSSIKTNTASDTPTPPAVVTIGDTKSFSAECGKSQNKMREDSKNIMNDTQSSGYQRPSTRHLLCQSLPTLTKAATATLAKAKSASNSNIQRMLVKSEDKSKDVKPSIPDSVPNNISNSNSNSFSSIMPLTETKKEFDTELDVKTDIVNTIPIGRKRGRPPKVRDSSSDSNTASDSSTYYSSKVKPKLSATVEKKPFAKEETDVKRSKLSFSDLSESSKILRSQYDDKKKLKLHCPKTSTSPSKQIDNKQDIKLMSTVKTEVIPKIKVEKVSPKGVPKHSSSLKDPPKEMFFKTKFVNGEDTPLKSPFLSKKCDLSMPEKTMGFNSLKLTKGSKEMKKSPPVPNDQRISKNYIFSSKSKSKEADKKTLVSSNNLKRKNSDVVETVDTKNTSLGVTKVNVSESSSSSRSSTGAKQQPVKSQKKEESSKGNSHKSNPNGKLNRKKSLLSYLKEKNSESDTSSVDSEAAAGSRRRSRSKEDSPKANSASSFPPFPPQPINQGSRRRSATAQGKSKAPKKPKWVHNWSWEGESFEGKIWLRVRSSND